MLTRLKNWWRGEFVETPIEQIIRGVEPEGHFRRPFLVRAAHSIRDFWLRDWRWLIRTIIALITAWILWLTYLKH